MTEGRDAIVVGRGLMGTACARHLAQGGARVTMIGPDEPADRATHDGPFASHHDAGRITRRLAHDADWAQLSARSIDRYAALERESGVPFLTTSGAMMAGPLSGPGSGFTKAFMDTAQRLSLAHERLDATDLATRFPFFSFAPGTIAAHETGTGYIDPRALRRAEEILAVASGAEVIRADVSALAEDGVVLRDGRHIAGDQIVIATGGYAATDTLLPERPAMRVYGRTVVLAEVDDAEAARLSDMPSLIFIPEGGEHDLYLLPPIRYPDGKLYLKIGGEDESPRLRSNVEMTRWFRGDGDAAAGERLLQSLRTLMPDLSTRSTHTASCAVAFTETGHPYIERLSKRLTLLTGGNGAGAKCCDELGRLGARVAMGQDLSDQGYTTDFHAVLVPR